ncbi:MAG: hypothetical protein EBZ48_02745 [Proteobacteria bacterium]|nr:hypothetical protein [Pseudomonadota bacterium]
MTEENPWPELIRDTLEELSEVVEKDTGRNFSPQQLVSAAEELENLIPRVSPTVCWLICMSLNKLIAQNDPDLPDLNPVQVAEFDLSDAPEEIKEFLDSLIDAVQDKIKGQDERDQQVGRFVEAVQEQQEKYQDHPLYKELMDDENNNQ